MAHMSPMPKRVGAGGGVAAAKCAMYVSRETFGGDVMGEIVDAISTVGFPIVCFLMSGYYVKYREDRNDEKVERLDERHDAELSKLSDVVNSNTIALQRLTDILDDGVKR